MPTPSWVGEPSPCDGALSGQPGQASPDGAFWASNDGDITAVQGGNCARLVHPKWAKFVLWTADSRYAVYEIYDQYGNSAGLVFDTTAWRQFGLPQFVGLGDMSGRFADGPLAVGPKTHRVLLGLGDILVLPGTLGRQVLNDTGQAAIVVAAWSPDEARLAFLAVDSRDAQNGAFFVAAGDGQGVRELAIVPIGDRYALNISWDGADRPMLFTKEGTWIFDANTLAPVQTAPAPIPVRPSATLVTPTPGSLVPGLP